MKKILLLLLLASGTIGSALALTANDVRIYINPGHGSWGPNDRPMATIPYPMLASTGRPDTCGFYESNTNLWKGFEMRDALQRMGVPAANITMSRTANGPFPYVKDASDEFLYNKKLTVIAAEAEEGDYDMFVSIHSNALTDGNTTNYPLYIYRGTNASESVTGSTAMCQSSWPRHWMDEVDPTYCSSRVIDKTHPYITGDVSFYGSGTNSTNSASGITYYGYLGALKHGVPGFLVEGYFHTYQPARHRALNQDYCRQEGLRLARGAADYFGISGENVGYIMGSVKDAVNSLENSLYTYQSGSIDAHAPINGAVVKLYKGDMLVGTYNTDNNCNGIFVFNYLAPGNDYKISVTANGYNELLNQGSYTVTANETSYMVLYMTPTDMKVKGIFAYDLNRTTNDAGEYVFTFKSNSDATAANLVFTDSISGEEVGIIPLSNIVEGSNTITLAPEQLPGNDGQVLSWAINVVGEPITTIERLNSVNATYTRATVAIDRSPESDYFGSIYVGNLVGYGNSANGIYRYDPMWQRENDTPYNGGETFRRNERMAVDGEGRLYVPDFGDTHSGIYIARPDELSNAGCFKQLFAGTRDGDGLFTFNGANTGSSVSGVSITGNGADTKIYASCEDMDQQTYLYDLGSKLDENGALPWTWETTPTAVHEKTRLKYSNVNLWAMPDGGLWLSENLYTTDGNLSNTISSSSAADNHPALRYINPDRSDYWTYATNSNLAIDLDGCSGGGFAINNDASMLVIADSQGILNFYHIDWQKDANGQPKPVLTKAYTYDADAKDSGCTSVAQGRSPRGVYQMAFDWGGNLLVAGGNLGVYSIPTTNNTSTTPAKAALTITKLDRPQRGDVNDDGTVDIDDVNALISIILGKTTQDDYRGNADVDGANFVDIDDVNEVIKIILSN